MTLFAINLGIFTILFFVIGMIKPKWVLFFIKKPTRFAILVITPILVMITLTMYGEGIKRKKAELEAKKPVPHSVAPVPVPVPAPEAPAAKPAPK